MEEYRVLGQIRTDRLNQNRIDQSFNTVEEAVRFVWLNDPLGDLWISCPDRRWFHPDTGQWR